VSGFGSTLATIWRLSVPYFVRSEDRWAGRILLAAVIATQLGMVAITVLINSWNNRFYNALQEKNWDSFVVEISYFCFLAAIYIFIAVYQLYLNQWLQIRWRRWMTAVYLSDWLDHGNHYRMQVLGDAADNPDQRIADDIKLFIEKTLDIGVGLLGSCVTLASFILILWNLSELAPLHLFGATWAIPGYLVWAALLYAIFGTLLTHLVGRRLIRLNFEQQRYEADFRFNLVRVRENGEQIALLSGNDAERARLLDRFAAVVQNWRAIMSKNKNVLFFTESYSQVAIVFPYIVTSPAYFSNAMQLGGMMQTASAFDQVHKSLSFFVNTYRQLAEWRAVIDRLAGFERAVALGRAAASTPPVVTIEPRADARGIAIDDLELRLPSGRPLVAADGITMAPASRVLVTGPSGAGKSTLFRAIAGVWPFGSGTVVVPEEARVMVLPQRPYLPVGSLLAAVSYPSLPGRFDETAVAEMLKAVGLPQFGQRLHEDAHWNRMLSLGEQQRLALARAILHAPDYLLLDEATASLDEPSEAQLYRLIGEKLPRATVISIGHRSTLAAFHERRLVLARDGNRYEVREHAAAAAAS
jgi:vitamin B12/bleomycin/antimicrobial peptide transport system ATP-binding/permease protein